MGADQPWLNPAVPCGQGQRKVMEWAGRGGPQDQLGPGDFWRPPGEGEVLK